MAERERLLSDIAKGQFMEAVTFTELMIKAEII